MGSYTPFVDISENQGNVDFHKMKSAGIDTMIPRAGINGRADHKFDDYVVNARKAGIEVPAAYWFINPRSRASADEQGTLFNSLLFRYNIPTAMYDCEEYSGEGGSNPRLTGEAYLAWMVEMRSRIHANHEIIYTGKYWWDAIVGVVDSRFTSLDLIIANYHWMNVGAGNDSIVQGVPPSGWEHKVIDSQSYRPPIPHGWDKWDAWQFSAGLNKQGPVYGCQSTDLDLNLVLTSTYQTWVGTTAPVTGEQLVNTLIVSPNFGAADSEYNAVFAGNMNSQGVVHTVRHLGPRLNSVIGFLPDNKTPRQSGTKVLFRSKSSMTDFTLDGPVPVNDKTTWTGANFYQGD